MELWGPKVLEPRDRKLFLGFFVAGIATLGFAGVMALLMLLVRIPAISLGATSLYYWALTSHGLFMFIFWLGFIQSGLLLAAGTVLIKRSLWNSALGWWGLALMVGGEISALGGIINGATTYSAAVPLTKQFPGTPFIYLGIILLTLGMMLHCLNFIMTVQGAVARKRSLDNWAAFLRDIPISTFAAISGLFIAIPGLILALKVYIPAFLWSVGLIYNEPILEVFYSNTYRMNWMVIFHIYHYIPALALVGVAYVLVELTADAKSVYNKHIAKSLFLLYPFFVPPTFLYHLLVDPNIPEGIKSIGTVLSLLVGTPTILHMFIIFGMLEARMRSAGYGLFNWFPKLPWGNPAFGSMLMGMLTLFIGGILSYMLIQEQIAPIAHNTFMVPAYVHPMAAGGANLIFMGALYYAVPLLTGRQLWGLGITRIQPYLMAAALSIMAIFGTLAGLAGVPRRVADISYAVTPSQWSTLMNWSLGVGGLLAIVAGIIFFLVIVISPLAGKKVAAPQQAIKGLEPLVLKIVKEHRRTAVALLPSASFIVIIIVLSLFFFTMLNLNPLLGH